MKIVIIGGTGLIGAKLVPLLRHAGHEVIAASPRTGVNTITGQGLVSTVENAEVVIDVSNSPSFEDNAVMHFFETSGNNLLEAEQDAGVKHHIVLSIVGIEHMQSSGYFRAKLKQEDLVKESGIPFTILRSTQFFEFAGSIANGGTVGQYVHIPSAYVQTIASVDVVGALAEIALAEPLNDTIEIAGPVRQAMNEFVGQYLLATKDTRQLVIDPHATYFGIHVDDHSLVPHDQHRIGKIYFEAWLRTADVLIDR